MKKAITILSVMAALVLCGCEKNEPENVPNVPDVSDVPNVPNVPNVPYVPSDNEHNGHEYVDMGLSVKWATMNVGASAPYEFGDYYAWGETEPYYTIQDTLAWKAGKASGYSKESYFDATSTKYNTTSGKAVLDSIDDAASVNWGGSWRMPTPVELKELSNPSNCTWTWQNYDSTEFCNTNGWKVKSKINGNCIFLPAAGERYGICYCDVEQRGYYWSNSLSSSSNDNAVNIFFHRDDRFSNMTNPRNYGSSVRPVFQ